MARAYNKISPSIRNLIMKAYDDGKNVRYISEIYGVKIKTIRSMIERFKKYGNEVRLKGTKKKKFNHEQIQEIKNYVNEDYTRTLEDIRDYVHDKFDIFVSISTIHRYIKVYKKDLNCARKKELWTNNRTKI